MNVKSLKSLPLTVIASVLLVGCGTTSILDEVVPDNTQEYRKAETMPPLDIPPDLSTARINDDIVGTQKSSTSYSEYQEEASNPLVSKYNITLDTKPSLAGEGATRHLIIPNSEEVIWQQLHDFSAEAGFEIKRQDVRIGLMDTVAGVDGYAYRFRLERGDTLKQSLIYISSAGADDNAQKNEAVLRQLAEYVGDLHKEEQAVIAEELAASPQESSVSVTLMNETDGQQSLYLEQDFVDVWRRVGRVLDSKGFAVEDRDRSRGMYFVHYIDPFKQAQKEEEGILDTIMFWQDDVELTPEEYYFIKLISDADNTKIIILDPEEVRTSTDTAKRLLALIQEQLTK